MEADSEHQSNQHFPEDREAPVLEKKSFLKAFYRKYKNPVDYIVFGVILITSLLTVSLSIYIIAVKYL